MLSFRVMLPAFLCMLASHAAMATRPPTSTTTAAESVNQFSCRDSVAQRKDVTIANVTLAGVPSILRIPKSIAKPPIVLWHGFGSPGSEKALMEALPLDDVPAIKVYLGLPLFGARAPDGGAPELMRRQSQDLALLVFKPVVVGAATELPAVVRDLRAKGCVGAGDAIGLFGFSAGGAAVLIALAEHGVRVGAAVTLNASTGPSASVQAYEKATKHSYSWTSAAHDLAKQFDATGRVSDITRGNPPPALLMIHAQDDLMLPAQTAISLHEALLPWYEKSNGAHRVQLEILPGMTHAWTGTSAADKVRNLTAEWFRRYL